MQAQPQLFHHDIMWQIRLDTMTTVPLISLFDENLISSAPMRFLSSWQCHSASAALQTT